MTASMQLNLQQAAPQPAEHRVASLRFNGSELTISDVFSTYWRFAAERQRVFFKKLEGTAPFTTDPILSKFKFTNAYRASDRVSQYLIRCVA